MMKLIQVHSLARDIDDAIIADITIEDRLGAEIRANYGYRNTDSADVALQIGDYIRINNPEILPYIPPPEPTPEELRAQMPSLTPRQFRDALIDADIMPDDVTNAISQIPDEKQRAKALNAWEYPTEFTRTDPLIDQIGSMFSLTPEQIDDMWLGALNENNS